MFYQINIAMEKDSYKSWNFEFRSLKFGIGNSDPNSRGFHAIPCMKPSDSAKIQFLVL